ncbi:MAG: FAD-binding oxidoreductase [Burkholderiales bacterium]|nr:FAD-binding oxidoreductase [Burkholderiales bacterium]
MKVAVIGGGINGVMTAWAFARSGEAVDLYEKGQLMSATSRSSSNWARARSNSSRLRAL